MKAIITRTRAPGAIGRFRSFGGLRRGTLAYGVVVMIDAGQPSDEGPLQPTQSEGEPGPEEEPDFASEHNGLSVADHDFGPEGRPDHETPRGYGGADWAYHRQLVV